MKLRLTLASLLLACSTSAVQASDKSTPDILASIGSESVTVLNKSDASKIRGEYQFCTIVNTPSGECHTMYTTTKPKAYSNTESRINDIRSYSFFGYTYYSSR